MLVYKLRTSKVTKTVFRLLVFKSSILFLMLLLTCLVKGFKIRSKKLLNLLVGHFGPPTISISFKSFNSEMVISSLFCSLIAYIYTYVFDGYIYITL